MEERWEKDFTREAKIRWKNSVFIPLLELAPETRRLRSHLQNKDFKSAGYTNKILRWRGKFFLLATALNNIQPRRIIYVASKIQ